MKHAIEILAPSLRELGFRKRGTSFWRRGEANRGVVALQSSRSSSATLSRFTVNVGVVSERLEAHFGNVGSSVWDAHYHRRIGDLVSPRADLWWQLDAGDPDPAVVAEVERAVLEVAVPHLDSVMSDEALRDRWLGSTRDVDELMYLSVLAKTLGPSDAYAAAIDRLRQEAANAGAVRVLLRELGEA